MREKELAEFNAEEAETLAAISSLGGAIKALAKHHAGASLLQSKNQYGSAELLPIAKVMQTIIARHAAVLDGVLTRSQKKMIAAFVQGKGLQPASAGSYAPASGEIIGMLKQMKETFETNVAQSQKDEKKAQAAYEELKASKEAEIAASQAQIETKTQELAVADEKIAHDKQDT